MRTRQARRRNQMRKFVPLEGTWAAKCYRMEGFLPSVRLSKRLSPRTPRWAGAARNETDGRKAATRRSIVSRVASPVRVLVQRPTLDRPGSSIPAPRSPDPPRPVPIRSERFAPTLPNSAGVGHPLLPPARPAGIARLRLDAALPPSGPERAQSPQGEEEGNRPFRQWQDNEYEPYRDEIIDNSIEEEILLPRVRSV